MNTPLAPPLSDRLAPATAHLQDGRTAEAEAWLSDYLCRFPNDQRAVIQLGELLRYKQDPQAVFLLKLGVQLDPKSEIAWLFYAFALRQSKRNAEAKEAFSEVLKINPLRLEALHDLGKTFMDEQNWDQAGIILARACGLQAKIPALYLSYAVALANLGRIDEAERAARQAQSLDTGNQLAIGMFLAKLGRERIPERAPDAFLHAIYASRARFWDQGVSNTAQPYKGAELVAEALGRLTDNRDIDVLDAGCGTGFVGELIGRRVQRLDGVDISAEMLEKARARNIYHSLFQEDLVAFFQRSPSRYHAITCAATFIHFGDLSQPLGAASKCLRNDGLLVFTAFPNDGDADNFAIGSLRSDAQCGLFEHGERYIKKVASEVGFSVEMLERSTHEYVDGEPRIGLVVALRLTALV